MCCPPPPTLLACPKGPSGPQETKGSGADEAPGLAGWGEERLASWGQASKVRADAES